MTVNVSLATGGYDGQREEGTDLELIHDVAPVCHHRNAPKLRHSGQHPALVHVVAVHTATLRR